MTLESLKTCSLDQVQWFWRQGLITDEVYEAYCHLWQTSAPRFSVQACYCHSCKATGPISDYGN